MRQQHKIFFFLIAVVLFSASCKKWLDVKPGTQVSEDDQFSSEAGFKEGLTGVYQMMAQPALYGKELSYGFIDVLGQNYTNTIVIGHEYFRAASYDYKDATQEARINTIWSNMYTAISQLNYILKNIDGKKSVFSGNNFEIIKGEALSLRAFLHFDLLRMFGPMSSNPGTLSIPYMKLFTVQPQNRISLQAALESCIEDLKAAEALLEVDKDGIGRPVTGGDTFLAYRQNKMNYWAVKGLLARLYLYGGNETLAFQKAKEVIDGKKFEFLKLTELNVQPPNVDRTATKEQLFGIYVTNLKALTDPVFKTGASSQVNFTFTISNARKADLFRATSDIRINPVFWSDSRGIVYYSKLWQEDNIAEDLKKRIPLMKLSEMYLIAAETAPTVSEGLEYFNLLRDARIDVLLSAGTTEPVLLSEIAKEYRKDFICEGQLFFFYKRNSYVNIPGAITGQMKESQYIFPLPNQEIEFGK